MEDPLVFLAVAGAALLGFTLAGVSGIGGGIITLPALIWAVGARDAIVALAITQLIAALGRAAFNYRDVSWPVVKWYCLGAVPGTIAGSFLFIATPAAALPRALGGAMLLIILFRHSPWGKQTGMRLRWFVPVGAVSGVVSGIAGVGGPLTAPFYLGYGLVTAAFVGTSAVNILVTHVPRLAIYGGDGLLSVRTLAVGVAVGLVAFLGSYLGRLIVNRISSKAFPVIVEITIVAVGVLMIVRG